MTRRPRGERLQLRASILLSIVFAADVADDVLKGDYACSDAAFVDDEGDLVVSSLACRSSPPRPS